MENPYFLDGQWLKELHGWLHVQHGLRSGRIQIRKGGRWRCLPSVLHVHTEARTGIQKYVFNRSSIEIIICLLYTLATYSWLRPQLKCCVPLVCLQLCVTVFRTRTFIVAADSYNVHVNSPDTSDYSIYCDIKVRVTTEKLLEKCGNKWHLHNV